MFCFLFCILVFCGGVKGFVSSFNEEPESVDVIIGSETILKCAISNYSGLIQWTRDGFALGGTLAAWPRYQIIGDQSNGEYHLKITDIELSDDAMFECQATEIAKRSKSAKVTVLSEYQHFAHKTHSHYTVVCPVKRFET
uniref:Ig-like domain-containing protein n=1 Tax=Callorhinchus milii TaxID=7868 RepID=A0A4W3H7H0_CALMI